MKKTAQVLFVILTMVLSISCAKGPKTGSEVEGPLQPLSCIVVLPAVTSVDNDDTINYKQARILEKGAAYTTTVLSSYLKDIPTVRILNAVQAASLVPEISGGVAGTMTELGKKLHCDGVLQTTVSRFDQRVGNDFGVESAASAELTMVLSHTPTGRVLWTSEFRETQQTVLSNILGLGKAQRRGFRWITVEVLVEQGVKERLGECPYL